MNVGALVRAVSLFGRLLICRKLKSHFKTFPPTRHPGSWGAPAEGLPLRWVTALPRDLLTSRWSNFCTWGR